MKTIKIVVLIFAVITTLSALGWVLAINNFTQWVDQYVAVSMLQTEDKPIAIAAISVKAQILSLSAPVAIASENRQNYSLLTIRELKKLCKGTGIKGWEKLRKAELINALRGV